MEQQPRFTNTEKTLGVITTGALLFGSAYGAGTGQWHIATACIFSLGFIFGRIFKGKRKQEVRTSA